MYSPMSGIAKSKDERRGLEQCASAKRASDHSAKDIEAKEDVRVLINKFRRIVDFVVNHEVEIL